MSQNQIRYHYISSADQSTIDCSMSKQSEDKYQYLTVHQFKKEIEQLQTRLLKKIDLKFNQFLSRFQQKFNQLQIRFEQKINYILKQKAKLKENLKQYQKSQSEILEFLFDKEVEINKQFSNIKEIGSGATCTFLEVIQIKSLKKFCLKMIECKRILQQEFMKKLINQAKILNQLNNKNIIQLQRAFISKTDSNQKYYSFLLEFGNYGTLVNCYQKFDLFEKYHIILGILKGLIYLHQHKIIHRDIKPQNIVLKEMTPKICDFGEAVKLNNIDQKRISYHGTIAYMSPQLLLQRSYDMRTDVWSFGILIFSLLYGKHPFLYKLGDTVSKYLKKIKYYKLIFPKGEAEVFQSIIQKSLKINPYQRITSEGLLYQYDKITVPKRKLIKFTQKEEQIVQNSDFQSMQQEDI